MQPNSKNDNLLILVIILSFAFLFYAFYSTVELTIKSQIITAVISTLALVVGWRWGSSKSSSNKDEIINQLQKESNTTTVQADTVNAKNIEVANSENINLTPKTDNDGTTGGSQVYPTQRN